MTRQRILAIEAGKDPKGVNAFTGAARDRDITLIQTQHLCPLNDPSIASRTGRPDGVVRPGDAHVQGDFTRRIVRDGSGIVMV